MLGRQVPNVTLKTRTRDENLGGDNPFKWEDKQTGEMFADDRYVVFSLPGAFTPTCSNEQCPAFERFYDDFKSFGV
ncbi:MAG: redoxin family protein, partial [Sphingomonadales bacterium]|nr:redoxin family protein [Sphingomonadales bacterium]